MIQGSSGGTVRAVILAGGYGTRMRPLTERRPKHLLPIGDEPVIAHQLHRLAAAGVEDVTLATSYHADAFRPALGDGSTYGLRLSYMREEVPLGTGGALRHALMGDERAGAGALSDDDVIVVLNGDLITDHDLTAHIRTHIERADKADRPPGDPGSPVLATIHGRPLPDASAFGLLHLDGDVVTRFEEKPAHAPAGVVNAGTYVVSPALLDLIPAVAEVSLERETFRLACERQGVRVYREDAPFHDIGTPRALLDANLAWAQEHPSAKENLAGGVCLSDAVSPQTVVRNSLVMSGAALASDAHVENSVVGPGVRIGRGSVVRDSVIGDDAVIADGVHLEGRTVDVGVAVAR